MEQEITLESLYQRSVKLEETLTLILNLLTKEERKKKEQQDERDEVSALPPIPTDLAARLLQITSRHLLRKRRQYKLPWEWRGRTVFYHIVPLIKAIQRLNLPWNEEILEEIKKSNRRIPAVR